MSSEHNAWDKGDSYKTIKGCEREGTYDENCNEEVRKWV
jgi:hypothetical protein